MKYIVQFMYIILFYFLGIVIKQTLNTIVPASVIGMILLFLALLLNIIKIQDIDKTAEFLLSNLALLFIPAGVGLITKFHLIKHDFINLIVVIIVTTFISQVTSILILKLIKKEKGNQ